MCRDVGKVSECWRTGWSWRVVISLRTVLECWKLQRENLFVSAQKGALNPTLLVGERSGGRVGAGALSSTSSDLRYEPRRISQTGAAIFLPSRLLAKLERKREGTDPVCTRVYRANGGSCRLGWHSQSKPWPNETVPAVVSGSAEYHFDQGLDHDHLQSGLQGSVMLVVHPEADQQKRATHLLVAGLWPARECAV